MEVLPHSCQNIAIFLRFSCEDNTSCTYLISLSLTDWHQCCFLSLPTQQFCVISVVSCPSQVCLASSQLLNTDLAQAGMHTVPYVIVVVYINNYFATTIITTVITADTQCDNVVINRNYDHDYSYIWYGIYASPPGHTISSAVGFYFSINRR